MSMSDEQFKEVMHYLDLHEHHDEVRFLSDRDTAQREALARVEAERDSAQLSVELWKEQYQSVVNCGNEIMVERDTAQAQLAEAVGLLREIESAKIIFNAEKFELNRRLVALLARHAQAAQQEAQGAQAEPANFGQEMEGFEKWRHAQADSLWRRGCPDEADAFIRLGSVQWAGWQARAALATQPAVPASVQAMSFEYAHLSGEHRTVSITREDVIEGMEDALYEKLSDQICRCEPIGETNVVECNCQDYVEEFALVSAKPAVRGAEHE